MRESLHDYMRVGIVHFMAYPECMGGKGPIAETVSAILRDPFFEVLEITHIADESQRNGVKSLADQARVELSFGAQPILLGGGLDLNHYDEGERTKAVDAVKAGMDEAATMGIDNVAVLSGKVWDDYEAGKQRLVDSLNQLCAHGQTHGQRIRPPWLGHPAQVCAHAESHGQRILLETFDQVPYAKNCLIGPTTDAVEISAAVRANYPSFGLLLDLSHLPLLGESSRDALETARDHLKHVHIGNCAMDDPKHPAYGDNHPRFGAPGTRNDTGELVEFLRVLLDIGYLETGVRRGVSFEVKPMPGESSEAVIAGSRRTLENAWRRL